MQDTLFSIETAHIPTEILINIPSSWDISLNLSSENYQNSIDFDKTISDSVTKRNIIDNQTIISQNTKHKILNKSYIESLKSLDELLTKKMSLFSPQKSSDITINLSSLLPILTSLDPSNNNKCIFPELFETIFTIFQHFPNIDKNTMRVLKLFSKIFEKNSFKPLEMLSKKVYKFYVIWKNHQILRELKEYNALSIKNIKLRKHVCRKLARDLQKKKISIKESQIMALNIERQVRNEYPDMNLDYIKKCKLLVKAIKNNEVYINNYLA
ncbi:hypothetical protein SteCoe_15768 [Stentor coeruleus]|uniref:Uncharacterized protein n=1 Tax=Stentor coeruleus TaxID=5963 RepID=A0A1R2C2U6_9CILI|nr:hypothetical protein SteCoe_15768 [Stentor coeruleus]